MAVLVGVVALVQSNVGVGIVAALLMLVSLWMRSTALDAALERMTDDAARIQGDLNLARALYAGERILHDATKANLERESLAHTATEGTLIKVTALWSRSIRPTTAVKYSARLLALKGESAALASAVMLSRAAPKDQEQVTRERVVFAEGGPVPRITTPATNTHASDAEPTGPTPQPSPWSLVSAWWWLPVAGALVFGAGVIAWWVRAA
ncbi:hypothetical protein LGT36_010800 [Demequina sp. TMPB413]|uniref:hypothetical protein n=1 Tax=Demequina sp. TMPB413 TaxID=2881056 RepID=UPI001CF50514|nr:hypothetical protein [Demequina sp. TMPB413]UPU87736.1 hypothetical protein LGT36_010800 [Demequina sp. TMPB413]